MEDFSFFFNNGNVTFITKGEDGYTANFKDENLMGTFTDSESLLYAMGSICQNNFDCREEALDFISQIADWLGIDQDTCFEILLK